MKENITEKYISNSKDKRSMLNKNTNISESQSNKMKYDSDSDTQSLKKRRL